MGTITMALAQTNEAKHGVIIKSTSRFNEGGTFNASETIGVADDDGGYLEATSKFDSTTISLRETFDGNGSNTGLLYKIEGQYNNEWQIATAIPEGNAYYSADPVSEFTVKEVKITVTGLASECDFFIAPAGTTTMDVNTTTLGSGRFDGVSMENTASWVYFWGTEADANGALIFVASWDGTLGKMQFTQTGGQVQIAP
jgi:hypothetical protein